MAETFSLYEEIEYPFPAGFKCFTASIESSCPHWHDAYEIVIPVTGQVTVRYKGAAYTLVRRSILLINSREIHPSPAVPNQMSAFSCSSAPTPFV